MSIEFSGKHQSALSNRLYIFAEQWRTELPCTSTSRFNELTLDIKDPASALREAGTADQTILGSSLNGELIPQLSLHRAIITEGMKVGETECSFSLSSISGLRAKDGVFYTDPQGKRLLPGPGPNHVRQYIKPGFQAVIGEGKYEPADTWTGMYELKHTGSFQNIGFGIDPNYN